MSDASAVLAVTLYNTIQSYTNHTGYVYSDPVGLSVAACPLAAHAVNPAPKCDYLYEWRQPVCDNDATKIAGLTAAAVSFYVSPGSDRANTSVSFKKEYCSTGAATPPSPNVYEPGGPSRYFKNMGLYNYYSPNTASDGVSVPISTIQATTIERIFGQSNRRTFDWDATPSDTTRNCWAGYSNF